MATDTKQRQAAKEFVKDWQEKGYEKGETARFWMDLLGRVFGNTNPAHFIQFELPVKTFAKDKGSDFIDAYIPTAKVLIEQKGSREDLAVKSRKSGGMELTPFQQGLRYASGLGTGKYPHWIVACNFNTFEVHNMETSDAAPDLIQLADIAKPIELRKVHRANGAAVLDVYGFPKDT